MTTNTIKLHRVLKAPPERAVSCGTELTVTQEGIPGAIPPEMCHLGWQESLDALARLRLC